MNAGGVESRKYDGTAVFKVGKLVPAQSLNLKKSLLTNNLFIYILLLLLHFISIVSQQFKIVVFFAVCFDNSRGELALEQAAHLCENEARHNFCTKDQAKWIRH